uniref:tRNA (guanine(46)-N(7))-methyltransferase n=1 Tax=Chrysotila carterae TaxID=13221 RepID=A0A7S4F6H1_CHRCT
MCDTANIDSAHQDVAHANSSLFAVKQADSRIVLCPRAIQQKLDRRSALRAKRDFASADKIKDELEASGVAMQDQPDGSTSWQYAPINPSPEGGMSSSAYEVGRLAREASANAGNDDRVSRCAAAVMELIAAAGPRPLLLGRLGGDAIFEFAPAGATDDRLFEALASQQSAEFSRWAKPQALTTLQVCERMSAAGLPGSHPLFTTAAAALRRGSGETDPECSDAADAIMRLGFSQPRPLRWLWRRAVRMQKLAPPTASASQRALGELRFDNDALPLIVDVGCGFGSSLLSLHAPTRRSHHSTRRISDAFNTLGCDASMAKTRFARGVAARWGKAGAAAFVPASATHTMEWVKANYTGPVLGVCLLFPTPFKVAGAGNGQLPDEDEYMVSSVLMGAIANAIRRAGPRAWLYIASNVEDVAVSMRRLAEAHGLTASPHTDCSLLREAEPSTLEDALSLKYAHGEDSASSERPNGGDGIHATAAARSAMAGAAAGGGELRRARIAAGGMQPLRAEGDGWRTSNPLDAYSETEATLELDGRPIFRVVMRATLE